MQNHHPFVEAIDLEIIMLACSHFDADMQKMVDTLEQHPYHPLKKLPLERMSAILQWQQHADQELISILPSMAQKAVQDALDMYRMMEKTIENDPQSTQALLYQLILYTGEDPFTLIDQLVMESEKSTPLLIEAMQNKKLLDPIYPGFGKSLQYVADALEGIQDPKAIAPLFETLLEQVGSVEESIIEAIVAFGEEARDYLIQILEKKPVSLRTTYAAKILLFLKNQEVSFLAVDLLCDPQTLKHTALVSYLIALLDTINKEERSAVLQQLLDEVHFSDEHRREIELFV